MAVSVGRVARWNRGTVVVEGVGALGDDHGQADVEIKRRARS